MPPTTFFREPETTIEDTVYTENPRNLIPSTFALGDLLLAGGGDGHVLLFDGSKVVDETLPRRATGEVQLWSSLYKLKDVFLITTPGKLTHVPWKGDHFKRRFHLPTMKFSGDLLVFRGVGRTYLRVNLLLIFQRTTESWLLKNEESPMVRVTI